MTHCTQKELAELFGISTRMVRNLINADVIHKEPNGRLDREKCITPYIEHLRKQAAGRISKDGKYDLIAERARLAKAQADKTELELKIKKGELMYVDVVEHGWKCLVHAARSKFLALPTKMAPQLAACQTPAEVQQLLKKEIYAAMTELSQTSPDEMEAEAIEAGEVSVIDHEQYEV